MVLLASSFDQSKYLRAEDLTQEKLLRIKSVSVEMVGALRVRIPPPKQAKTSVGDALNSFAAPPAQEAPKPAAATKPAPAAPPEPEADPDLDDEIPW